MILNGIQKSEARIQESEARIQKLEARIRKGGLAAPKSQGLALDRDAEARQATAGLPAFAGSAGAGLPAEAEPVAAGLPAEAESAKAGAPDERTPGGVDQAMLDEEPPQPVGVLVEVGASQVGREIRSRLGPPGPN